MPLPPHPLPPTHACYLPHCLPPPHPHRAGTGQDWEEEEKRTCMMVCWWDRMNDMPLWTFMATGRDSRQVPSYTDMATTLLPPTPPPPPSGTHPTTHLLLAGASSLILPLCLLAFCSSYHAVRFRQYRGVGWFPSYMPLSSVLPGSSCLLLSLTFCFLPSFPYHATLPFPAAHSAFNGWQLLPTHFRQSLLLNSGRWDRLDSCHFVCGQGHQPSLP